MPRRLNAIRTVDFLGESDDTPATIGDTQASVLQNMYKRRRGIRRRKGFSALAASLGSATVRMLSWYKLGSAEHLLEIHDGDVRDWLAATPGEIVGGGTDALPSSGTADANSAWIDDIVYIGNGLDANVRYNGAGAGLAADFAPNATDALKVNRGTNALFEGQDLSGVAWVKFDSLAFNATGPATGGRLTVCAIDDRGSSARKSWRVVVNPNTNRFNFAVHDAAGAETTVADTTVLATGVWYCVRWRHNAALDQIAIQVNNGTLQTAVCAHGLDQPASGYFSVGYTPNLDGPTGNDAMDGQVGPIGIWRSAEGAGGALSNTLLADLYNNSVPLLEADLAAAYDDELVAYWDMGEASGTRDDDHNVTTTFDLIPFGAGVGSAAGPHGQVAILTAGVPQAGDIAGPATLNSGTLPAGIYFYKATYINADGVHGQESETAFEVDTTAFAPRRINVAGIPLGPAGTVSRGLWRLDPDAISYRLTTTLADNTTTSYDDNNADLTGTETLVEGNSTMPPIRYWAEHNSRVVGAGNFTEEGGEQTVYISNKFEPWACPIVPDLENVLHGTRAKLQGRASGEITGVHPHGQFVAVFTGGAGYFLSGDQPYDFALNRFSEHGCAAHRTIVSARDLLIWLGSDAVWAFDGRSVFSISEDQRATIEAMTVAGMQGAHAFVWDDKYFLCWATGCIVFDLQYKVWSTNTNWLWQDSTVTEFTSGGRERIYAAVLGIARVYQLETGATDDGTAIPARWASKDWDAGALGREKRAHYIEVRAKKSTGTLTVVLKKGSGQTVQTDTHDLSTVDHADETVTRYRESCVEQARSEFFRLDISTSTVAAEFELDAAQLEFQVAE